MKHNLVLIPGLLCDHQLWRHQCIGLADIADIFIGDTLRDESIHSMAARVLENLIEDYGKYRANEPLIEQIAIGGE